MAKTVRRRISVNGTVQGIGFRPFIYRMARERNLGGFVTNTTSGVLIEAEGPAADVACLVETIRSSRPAGAEILSLETRSLPVKGENAFSIVPSRKDGETSLTLAPDTATCAECIREIFDPSDRRFRHPFNNCINCGPRYSITERQPFDRRTTAMKAFRMCEACEREYHDPMSRRFHSQTNSCPHCGPRVWLVDSKGEEVEAADPVELAADLLGKGKIVGIKGIGGFHLCANAENEAAVAILRQRKRRPSKPFAIMSARLEDIESYAHIDEREKEMLASRLSPIVILRKRAACTIAESVAPNQSTFGAMLAYTPIHHLILRGRFTALVMTSGNRSEEPLACSNEEAIEKLGAIADFFLLHDRDIIRRCDDSIVKFFGERHIILRRARGYVPRPIMLNRQLKPTCAYGAHLKNTVCVTKGDRAYVSRYIGDLDNLESLECLEETISNLEKLLSVKPEIVACDMHPGYVSTKLARERSGVGLHAVQHHHAHIASCMGENRATEKVIGIALDGAGLGDDGAIWGSEFIEADLANYRRLAHLKYVPMPGGEAAVREPYRMAISYLYGIMGEQLFRLNLDIIRNIGPDRIAALINMIRWGDNSPPTSGMGRLFDAVSAILGLCAVATFEGEGPGYLESAAESGVDESYGFALETDGGCTIIDPAPLLMDILGDIRAGVERGIIAARFHNAIIEMIVTVCLEIRQNTGLSAVALSGGVFQNAYLLSRLLPALGEKGFPILTHKALSPNDECISFGQALIANKR